MRTSRWPFASTAAFTQLWGHYPAACYYQPRPSPARGSNSPEAQELIRRLHEMRDACDLTLQFGPHKRSTLAQVAMSNPEYIRQLMASESATPLQVLGAGGTGF